MSLGASAVLPNNFTFAAADPVVAQRGSEAELVDAHNLIYRVYESPVPSEICEIRVGGIPWRRVSGEPGPGEWSIICLPEGVRCFQLGSTTLGSAVRYYFTDDPPSHQEWRALNEQ